MNKIKVIASAFVIGLTSLTPNPSFASENEVNTNSVDVVEERFEEMDGHFDYKLTPEIQKLITSYTKYRVSSEILLGRSSVYFPLFEKVIAEKNLPEELKYISVIESSLKPYAKSHVGAAGLWQFMKTTGRMMGLTINRVVDERNDLIKSTEAALNYLEYLHEMFGDWTLAIAAYNCGPGNVKKAIRKANSTDFWVLKKYLPRETRQYVPKFMATAYFMEYYNHYGLEPSDKDILSNPTTVMIYEGVSFKELTSMLDTDLKTLQRLNPAYLKGYVPGSDEGNHITLPEEKMYDFIYQHQVEYNIVYQPVVPVVEEEEIIPIRVMINVPYLETIQLTAIAPVDLSDEERMIWNKYHFFEQRKRASFTDRIKKNNQNYSYFQLLSHLDEQLTKE